MFYRCEKQHGESTEENEEVLQLEENVKIFMVFVAAVEVELAEVLSRKYHQRPFYYNLTLRGKNGLPGSKKFHD
jgi:hypothetical protein